MTEKLGAYIQVSTEEFADARALQRHLVAALKGQPLTPEQSVARNASWKERRAAEHLAAHARHDAVRALADGSAPFRRLVAVITLHAPDDDNYCQGCPGEEPTEWDDCPTIAAIKGDQ